MRYWQVATGSEGRNYWEVCLKFGIAFIGWGGDYCPMDDVQPGDVLILKTGKSVAAVGHAVKRGSICNGKDEKEWLNDFDGWALPAYCYVEWHKPPQPIGQKDLTRATMQGVNSQDLKQWADSILQQYPALDFDPEPSPTTEVNDNEIRDFLIRGLSVSRAAELNDAFTRIRLLAKYYQNNCDGKVVREHETRTFLVIPLLLALGWTEQQIKVEYHTHAGKVDIAGFDSPYHAVVQTGMTNNHCVLLIETKGFSQGLHYAPAQVMAYAQSFPQCNVVAVSNGFCYRIYVKHVEDDKSSFKFIAYMNLLDPRDRYPLDPKSVGGTEEAFLHLLP
ncbi:MAG: hypothetical protein ACLP5H_13780 [Desulfomonilaceae bacterium]